MKIKTIICSIFSWLLVAVIGIAIIGAIASKDTIFSICGGVSAIAWLAIVIRTIKANDPNDPASHPNHL